MTRSPEELKALATRVLQGVFSEGRSELIDELYVPSLGDTVRKLSGTLRAAFPDLRITIDHLIAEGSKVACRWTATATQKDWFYNIPPTGATVTFTGTSFYVVDEDGLIEVVTTNWDLFGLLQQLRMALR